MIVPKRFIATNFIFKAPRNSVLGYQISLKKRFREISEKSPPNFDPLLMKGNKL